MSVSSLLVQVRKALSKARMVWLRRTKLRRVAGLLLGGLLITFGAYGLFQWLHATQQGGPIVAAKTLTESTANPDETPIKNYEVVADMPRQITVPSIGAQGFIQKVGSDSRNTIVVPNNVHLAGWYVKSPKPGDKGVSIIAGHVQGKYSDGVFRSLAKVRAGNEIFVEFGDRSKRQFIVQQVDTLSVDETSKAQYENITNTDTQLTLITCGGAYNKQEQSYDKRIVVRAELRR
jgi:LPXTG-site transpeptidase (sortase) family protein